MSEFDERVAPYRRELLAHCYRMTGALSDAEDALQEALLRAWRGLAGFEGRSSLRSWLYRIATNACLDLIAESRGRSLPNLVAPAGAPDAPVAPAPEATWLEPFPDSLIEDDPETRPDAVYSKREATRLAFVAALQQLSARQRAVLILRDVVALSAEETAAALDVTVATANSLLQRARAALPAMPRSHATPSQELLARYLRAWEDGDPEALIAVLCSDAVATMPPAALWMAGIDAILAFMSARVWTRGPLRLVPFAANDAPAFAVYDRSGALTSLTVLEIDGNLVAAMHSFMAPPAGRYGLVSSL
jgi:RNA polymerase sigma-70 factor (ECF subfamily)